MTKVNFQSKSGSFFLGLAMRRIRKFGAFTWLGRTFQTGGECAEYICDSLCRRQIRAAGIVDMDPEPTAQQRVEREQDLRVLNGTGSEEDESRVLYRHDMRG